MDLISDYQLQKYERQLSAVQEELDKSKKLKDQIQDEETKLTILKLTTLEGFTNLAYVTVKIFTDFAELYHLYSTELPNIHWTDFQENCKFYLIEITFLSSIHKKCYKSNAQIQINVKADGISLCKSFSMRNTATMLQVVPVDANVTESVIDCCIWTNDCWLVMKLQTVYIDMSYYLDDHTTKMEPSLKDNVKEIAQLYNSTFLQLTEFAIEKPFTLDISLDTFMANLVRNCYHCLDLNSIEKLLDSEHQVTRMSLVLNRRKLVISYEKERKVLRAKSHYANMEAVGKYFAKYCTYELAKVDQGYKMINMLLFKEANGLEELLRVYEKCRKIWLI